MPLSIVTNDWIPESFRLTVFTKPENQSSTISYWQQLLSEDPETILDVPKKQERQEKGKWQEANLSFVKQLGREEWVLTFDNSLEEFAEVPLEHAKGEPFFKFLESWLEICPPVARLAFGIILLKKAENLENAYSQLSENLPFKLEPGSSDFLYQINRARQSVAIPGWKINRLSKWSAVKMLLVEMDPNKPEQGIRREDYYCRLELDINTHFGQDKDVPKDKLVGLLAEFVSFAHEIIEKGDCP